MNGKEAMSFLHDSNSRHDVKMLKLWEKFGYEGIGVFWCIVEILREQPDFKYSIDDISLIGIELRIDKDLIKDLIRFCLQPNISLFIEEDNRFFSESLLRRMDKFKESRLRMSQGGKLGMKRRYSKGVSKVVISKLQGANKVKEKKTNIIETKTKIISSLKKIWFDQIQFYMEKYPGLDYNLELEKMEEWIGRNINKASKRTDWNLFIQSWLGRVRPNFGFKKQMVQKVIETEEEKRNKYDDWDDLNKPGEKILEQK